METNNEMWNASATEQTTFDNGQSAAGCDEEWNVNVPTEQIEEELRNNNFVRYIRGNSDGLALTPEEVRQTIAERELTMEPSGLFCSKEANTWMEEAQKRPDPVPLWHTLWHENEVACLFADTNMGKSIYAVQIADAISKAGRRVMYFDFELSDKQFQLRYTDPDTGQLYPFSPLLIRTEFAKASIPDTLEEVVSSIEAEVVNKRCKIVIIDNITWICNRSESGDAAGELMTLLIGLKRKWGLSILCLAHTPKRAITSALTQNSLAGSKRIANFMDSLFAIGVDRTNQPSGRYVKQVKVRSAELSHGEEQVMRCEIVKDGGMLRFDHIGTGDERMLLAGNTEPDKDSKTARIIELANSGMTQQAIAAELSVSQSTVSATLKRWRESGETL